MRPAAVRRRAGAARLLREAEGRTAPVEPLSTTWPALDLADAYAVQQDNITRRLAAGSTVIGHKVGLASTPIRELLGVYEPDFGHLLDEMVHRDGGTVRAARYCAPRVEPEICFRLARPLRGPGVTLGDVLTATDAVAPALEIVDSRIRDWRIALTDTVADNAGSAGLVCGSWTPMAHAPDLAAVTVDLFVDGTPVATGSGREVLGHPAAAVAWLANALATYGKGLDAGHVILPGAMTTAPLIGAGQKAEARFGALGSVSASFV
ncbi:MULTISPECIES: 2-keto-4-pentenoate hydratase [unclassified Streptomyces]|uniref:2-keto-4-pentenoate hydratase n=1 Tax=unclassified Streptomyces TaxID=2593676 RepID=UPI00158754F9|nr:MULTISPECIES: fumarylacetoacetate hydrolase family protein [unclassified Streptomyces]NUV70645.1 2-keto-4-pentenoate hydratase [Streptomyces sp. CAI-121]NUV98087.1 2-keto-4-pentenoate hydratase [Streptomyces sp. CAI 127]NUW17445.1 2-keto-4-pentenoate hydratase [Streptomyces sp. CAI-68]